MNHQAWGLLPWSPGSWQDKIARQQPHYENERELAAVLCELDRRRALVSEESIEDLREELTRVQESDGWVVHGGDCAERFCENHKQETREKLAFLQEIAALWSSSVAKPTTLIGRIAGQFAKPRSREWEQVGEELIPVFRGDNIHSITPTLLERRPDPQRLLRGYDHTSSMMAVMEEERRRSAYPGTCYTSHEGLLLPYEQSFTRLSPRTGEYYNRSTHLLWLGERTRGLGEAHVEYFRGIENPIAVKIGPEVRLEELEGYLRLFNPKKRLGKLMFITRLGARQVEEVLPSLIMAVQRSKVPVLWSCDPMHGNASLTPRGQKTRYMSTMLEDFEKTYSVHKKLASRLHGLHLEMTPEPVRECLSVGETLGPEEILEPYLSYCDPRLNSEQSKSFLKLAAQML